MRIAQVAPLIESVPPRFYGGTERIVSYLTEELVRQGHEVTLFASGDSVTAGRAGRLHQPGAAAATGGQRCPALSDHARPGPAPRARVRRPALPHRLSSLPAVSGFRPRTVTTLHGRLDLPDLLPVFAAFPEMPLVSISDAPARGRCRTCNWLAHGPSRPARATCCRSRPRRRRLPRLPRPHLRPRSGRTARSRSPSAPASG